MAELELAEERLEKAFRDVKIAFRNARRELQNMRLTRKEVASLMGYNSVKYTYDIKPAIPFGQDGCIFYNDLEQWTYKNKSNRLKRLQSNYRHYLESKLKS